MELENLSPEELDRLFAELQARMQSVQVDLKAERERAEEIRLYNEKNDYLLGEELRYKYGFEMRELDLRDYFDRIFNREWMREDQNYEAYEFEEIGSQEYQEWKERHDSGVTDMPYNEFSKKWRYNPIVRYTDKKVSNRKKNKAGRMKHRIILKDDEESMRLVEGRMFAITSPITYCGSNRCANNARFLFAIALDLDGVEMPQLKNVFHQQTHGIDSRASYTPVANIVVNSGHGLHLYYILEKPVPLYRANIDLLFKLKTALVVSAWNEFTSTVRRQLQPIFQGFRVPGSKTKFGEPVRAFENVGAKYYTIRELNDLTGSEEEHALTEEEVKQLADGLPTKTTLLGAKELYPEWYERVIVNGIKSKNKMHINRGLYDWWLRRLRSPTRSVIDDVQVGHRYYSLFVLAIFAKKCDITEEELHRDAFSLKDKLDDLSEDENNRFTDEDIMDSFAGYDDKLIRFSRQKAEEYSGMRIIPTRRNGMGREMHLFLARQRRDAMRKMKKQGEWDENNGRKPCGQVVKAWRKENPNGTKTQCIAETGLSKPTVLKWWGNELSAQDLVMKWKITHPDNENKSLCARETGLDRKTVSKWW